MKLVYLFAPWDIDRKTLDDVLTVEGTNVQYSVLGTLEDSKGIEVLNSSEKPLSWLQTNNLKQAAVCIHTEKEEVIVEKFTDSAGCTLWTMYPAESGPVRNALTVMLRSMKVWDVSLVFDFLRLKSPVIIGTRGYLVYNGPSGYVMPGIYVWESNS